MSDSAEWAWLDAILDGIDRDESDDKGWWETSTGAAFGARKMDELKQAIAARLAELEQRPPDGYLVLCKSRLLDGSWRYRTSSSAHHVQTTAEEAAKHRAVSSEERAYVVAEVREVPGCAT